MLRPLIRNGPPRSLGVRESISKKSLRSPRRQQTTHATSFDPQHFVENSSEPDDHVAEARSTPSLWEGITSRLMDKKVGSKQSSAVTETGAQAKARSAIELESIGIAPEAEDGVSKLDKFGKEEIRLLILKALKSNDAHALLYLCSRSRSFLQDMPPTLALEVLRAIDPAKFLDPYVAAYQSHLRPYGRNVSGPAPGFVTFVARDLVVAMRRLFYRLQETLDSPRQPIYKTILRVAAAAGDGDLASLIFEHARSSEDAEPDTEMYNLFLAAKCWDNCLDPINRRRLRVTERALFLRDPIYQGPNFGFDGYRSGSKGVSREVIHGFNDMVEAGLVPNADSFASLMVAMGREGDLKGIAEVLLRAWDIDVYKIMSSETDEIYFEHDIPPDSPKFPTQSILFSIAHIYGSNNQIATALRVVDHISRKFSLPVGPDVWSELAGWTYCLSSRRPGRSNPKSPFHLDRAKDKEQGKVPYVTFENLWQTMINDPYTVKPSLDQHGMRVRSLQRRALYHEAISALREAKQIFALNSKEIKSKKMALRKAKQSQSFSSLEIQNQETALIEDIANARLFGQLIRMFLHKNGSWTGIDDYNYQYIAIPNLIAEFSSHWLNHHGIGYNTRDGFIQFSRTTTSSHKRDILLPITKRKREIKKRGKTRPVTMVSHLNQVLGRTYMEKSWSRRQLDRRSELLVEGQHRAVKFPISWQENWKVANWIWTSNTEGQRSTNSSDVEILDLPNPRLFDSFALEHPSGRVI